MEGTISTRTFVLIEAVLSFGGVLVFCFYQLWSVRRAIARRKAREQALQEPLEPDAGGALAGAPTGSPEAGSIGLRGIR
jgi:hypothetical protein